MNERKFFLLSLIAVLGGISFLMVKPFVGYLIGAAILAFVMRPAQKELKKVMPERIAAIMVVIMGLSMIIMPFAYSILAVFEDAKDLDADFEGVEFIDVNELEQFIFEISGQQVDVRQNIQQAVEGFVSTTLGSFSQFIGLLADLTIGISLMLFVMYYLIVDGESLIAWVKDITPLPQDIQDELYEGINVSTWAVIKGHILVAVVQGLLAGLGLALTGVPNYALWTFIMVILAFIPIIGTFMVWGPASVYLVLIGQPLMGVLLAVYGFIVVGLSDNFLRPFAVDRAANLHPATILLGVIGGVYLFGAAGLFIGPIILGVFKSVLLVFKNSYKDL